MTHTPGPVLAPDGSAVPRSDVDVVCRLAAQKRLIADDPVNCERRDLWYRHDSGTTGRPMVLAEVGGIRDATHPLDALPVECEHPWTRGVERALRTEIWQFEELRDDHVIEPYVCTGWQVQVSDFGVEVVQHQPDFDGTLGARRWDSPIADIDRDFGKLRPRTYSVDCDATETAVECLAALLGDALPVQIRGGFWWTLGMTWTAIELIGLEGLMMAMYDHPEGLRRLMGFLRDDSLAYAGWLEDQGLLSLNNENDYIGSGSMGYTRDLPAADTNGNGHVRRSDQWVLLESQETVGVSPELFGEFIFPYQLSIAEEFGKCYYGCCEPVDSRIHVLKGLPNLARISVSPWADEEVMARECGVDIVFSRKPNPTLIGTEVFNEEAILADLRHTLQAAAGCRVEFAMKDVHTLDNKPGRLARWVELARQAIDESAG